MASRGDIALIAGRDAGLGGKAVAAGDLKLDGGRNLTIAQAAQLDAEGKAQLKAGQDATLAGAMRSNLGNRIEAGGACAWTARLPRHRARRSARGRRPDGGQRRQGAGGRRAAR